jgi:high-affinity Fe2+/Pb2+ permease
MMVMVVMMMMMWSLAHIVNAADSQRMQNLEAGCLPKSNVL